MKYFSVKNFDKYQPKRRGKNVPWIRLYVNWMNDWAIGQLKDSEKAHYAGLLCIASRTDNRIQRDPVWIKRQLQATSNVNLEKFETLGLTEVLGDHVETPKIKTVRERKGDNGKEKKGVSQKSCDPPPTVKEISDTTKAIRSWKAEYEKQIGKPPDMSHGKDQAIMKSLVDKHGLEGVFRKISVHIAGRKLLTIGGLKTLWNDLGVSPAKNFETFEEKNEREREKLRRKYQ